VANGYMRFDACDSIGAFCVPLSLLLASSSRKMELMLPDQVGEQVDPSRRPGKEAMTQGKSSALQPKKYRCNVRRAGWCALTLERKKIFSPPPPASETVPTTVSKRLQR
jgi:hypothetical protein